MSMPDSSSSDGILSDGSSNARREQEWQQIREALRNLRFGSVNIVVQDGVIVQIDRTEKRRLRLPPNATNGNS